MAKLSSVQKNLFRKKLIKKYKSKRDSLKAKIKNKNISLEERISYQNTWDNINKINEITSWVWIIFNFKVLKRTPVIRLCSYGVIISTNFFSDNLFVY